MSRPLCGSDDNLLLLRDSDVITTWFLYIHPKEDQIEVCTFKEPHRINSGVEVCRALTKTVHMVDPDISPLLARTRYCV